MRALEIVLSFANALALASLAVRSFRGGRPAGFAGLMAASSAGL